MKRQIFTQKLHVIGKPRPFERLDEGDCFAKPGAYGFGELWIGFPIYIKVNETTAYTVQDGRRCDFSGEDEVVLVKYQEVDRPL